MILLTPASIRSSASALTAATVWSKVSNVTRRGEEIVGVSGGEMPMMPISSPLLETMTEFAIRPESRSACSDGSASKWVLAVRNCVLSAPVMNWASRSGPKSYSWLPIVVAS